MKPNLVENNPIFPTKCFTVEDKVSTNRPKSLTAKILGYDVAMFGFSPHGPYRRQVHKIATVKLLSNHCLQMLRDVLESEAKASIKGICTESSLNMIKNKSKLSSSGNNVLVEMKKWFRNTTLNLILRVVVGKQLRGEICRGTMREFFKLSREFVMSDVVTILKVGLGWA